MTLALALGDENAVSMPVAAAANEICNYPFTTWGILMGHTALSYQNFQVTDTPGILRRCDVDMNNLEKLTLAVLAHLPTALLFVDDLTGECGASPSDQFLIYQEIKQRFSSHLWIDVVSKCGLLHESPVLYITEDTKPDPELLKYRKKGSDGALFVSVISKARINEENPTLFWAQYSARLKALWYPF